MRAVALENGELVLRECAVPGPGPDEVRIRAAYAGVNRADLLQKQGRYPGPGGSPAIPGMEVSGIIDACGGHVQGVRAGDRVCALLSEGGYGEYAVCPAAQVLPVPPEMTMEAASALPEACFTSWISLVWQGRLRAGESVLIHGGASGIGSIAIQVAKLLGARVFATAGSQEKCASCLRAGADRAIAYKEEDFVQVIQDATHGKGVDVILDMVGGDYTSRNIASLAHGGRLCIIAFLKGAKAEVNMAPVLLKHLRIMGSTLRSRPPEEKARLAREVRRALWEPLAQGRLKPMIDRIFPLEEAAKALGRMDQGLNIGKILLRI